MTAWWGWVMVVPITAFGLMLAVSAVVDREQLGPVWPVPFMFGVCFCLPFLIAISQ